MKVAVLDYSTGTVNIDTVPKNEDVEHYVERVYGIKNAYFLTNSDNIALYEDGQLIKHYENE